jgi:hypothetical protein
MENPGLKKLAIHLSHTISNSDSTPGLWFLGWLVINTDLKCYSNQGQLLSESQGPCQFSISPAASIGLAQKMWLRKVLLELNFSTSYLCPEWPPTVLLRSQPQLMVLPQVSESKRHMSLGTEFYKPFNSLWRTIMREQSYFLCGWLEES